MLDNIKRRKKYKLINDKSFDELLYQTRIDPDKKSGIGARLVMVRGIGISEAAKIVGVSRQAVHQTLDRLGKVGSISVEG
jgi:predicted ArsR family transcriptional regulator